MHQLHIFAIEWSISQQTGCFRSANRHHTRAARDGISGLQRKKQRAMIVASLKKRKEGHVYNFYCRFYQQRGPVNALQMRLQG
jgi:hypothetical protein